MQKFAPKDKTQQELQDLYRCLQNLKEQKKQTNNYLEHTEHLPKSVCNSYKNIAKYIEKQIKIIESKIDNLILNNTVIKKQIDNIQTIPGIGKLTAVAILGLKHLSSSLLGVRAS